MIATRKLAATLAVSVAGDSGVSDADEMIEGGWIASQASLTNGANGLRHQRGRGEWNYFRKRLCG
jgi:hypothetical protein